MKKIGLLALAIVLALGALGVGYAMWYQSVDISGTVQTGTVNISVSTPTGTLVYKDLTQGENYGKIFVVPGTVTEIPGTLPAAAIIPTNSDTGLLVAVAQPAPFAATDCTTPNGSLTIDVVYANLFPLFDAAGNSQGTYDADFTLTNTGSIPVKAEPGLFTPTNLDGLTYQYLTEDAQSNPITLEGYQIDPGESIHVKVCITVPDEATAQNLSGSFTSSIDFVQWNEYTAPAP